LFCILNGPTRGRHWSNAAARTDLRDTAVAAGVRRRFAPHQLRHAHAVELAREGVPLIVIQRQLGHSQLGITSVYLQGIDNAEIIDTVHARRAPMIPVSNRYGSDRRQSRGAARRALRQPPVELCLFVTGRLPTPCLGTAFHPAGGAALLVLVRRGCDLGGTEPTALSIAVLAPCPPPWRMGAVIAGCRRCTLVPVLVE
jgi:integrase/recombinase XerD